MEVLGGSDGEKTHRECWRLEAGATQWKPSGTAPVDTVFGRAAVSGGKTYLFGGCADVVDLMGCGDGVHVREADGQWRRVSTLPQGPIAMPAAASVQGKTYFFGGCSMQQAGALKNRDDAYSYDPATNQWKRLRALPHANRGMTAAAANDRFILLYGGYTASVEEAAGKGPEYGFTAAVLAYDIQEDRYRDAGTAPLAAAGVELLYQTGRLYAVGGEQRMKGRSARLMTAGVRQQE
jgi:N-acetylneuraminic acid mutarotase